MTLADFPAFNRLKACRYGQMVYNPNDTYVGRSLDLYGEFSEGEVELFRQLVQPGDVVIDVGANIGAHTLFLARHVGPRGLVLAFEPQRILFQTLCANLALNSITNVVCFHQAAGAESGFIRVPLFDFTRPENFGGLELSNIEAGEQVPLVPLDSYYLQQCNFIKIDVEGMEEQVLRGAAAMIARLKPILVVENDRQDRAAELIRYIDSLGYRMYWHLPILFNPKNFLANANNVFPQVISANLVCVHRQSGQELAGLEAVEVPAAKS